MGLAFEAFVELDHLLVDHHFADHGLFKFDQLLVRGQHPVKQQITRLHIGRVLGQLLDRISTIEKFTFIAVDVADI